MRRAGVVLSDGLMLFGLATPAWPAPFGTCDASAALWVGKKQTPGGEYAVHVPKFLFGGAARCAAIGWFLTLGACDALYNPIDGARGRSTLTLAAAEASDAPTHVESDANDDFATAEAVTVGETPTIIQGDLG